MREEIIISIDPSLKNTGITIYNTFTKSLTVRQFGCYQKKKKRKQSDELNAAIQYVINHRDKSKKEVMNFLGEKITSTQYNNIIKGDLIFNTSLVEYGSPVSNINLFIENIKLIFADVSREANVMVIIENMYSSVNYSVGQLLSELVGIVKTFCYLNEFDFLKIKPIKGKPILKTITGETASNTKDRKAIAVKYIEQKENMVTSDDIADSYVLLQYYIKFKEVL